MVVQTANARVRDRIGGVLRNNKLVMLTEIALVLALDYVIETRELLPASTPVLILIGWLSLWLRRAGWRGVGLRRPQSWTRTLLIGVGAGIALSLVIDVLGDPLFARLTGEPIDLGAFGEIRGNLAVALITIVLGWVLGGFGEELAYRGYILNRIADVGNRQTLAWIVGIVLTSVLFGLAHAGQGMSGVISSGLTGIGYALVYLLSGRNLWAAIVAHGVANTFTILLIYFGLYTGM